MGWVVLLLLIGGGLVTAPFDWPLSQLPRDPVPVDAIPDLGDNQQIVFTDWPGRSPQDVEDQITYPLTTALLGMPGVRTIRSNSMLGLSSIYIIFEEGVDFYWSRSRIVEKLNSLPAGILPAGVQPGLGPDATALGQIFWYTVEGRDQQGKVTGGWDLDELRAVQDFQVRYALAGVSGVAEVASIGGYVREYQLELDPVAMQTLDVPLEQVIAAVKGSNLDVGARTLEINQAEYLLRGIGYVKSIADLEEALVLMREGRPIRLRDVARVQLGPAARRGILDKGGAEVVGGVVVARYGGNPMATIAAVKAQIEAIAPSLPARYLEDGRYSQLTIVPFYDRTQLIEETLGTLEHALQLEILIVMLVILLMVFNLRASALVAGMLPVAVLVSFILMRYTGVEANIVALSGIAIAIGTLADMGIVLTENIIQHLRVKSTAQLPSRIANAAAEVAPALLTAGLTTIVSFLPILVMEAAEGKLFRPLALTKTYVLLAAVVLSILILPMLAHSLYRWQRPGKRVRILCWSGLLILGAVLLGWYPLPGILLLLLAVNELLAVFIPRKWAARASYLRLGLLATAVLYLLTKTWLPLGPGYGFVSNLLFVALLCGLLLGSFQFFLSGYEPVLRWCLAHKKTFLAIPALLCLGALTIWLGFSTVFAGLGWLGDQLGANIRESKAWKSLQASFPGVGEEFMPRLDEGAFLLMPTSMPHAGMEENKRVLQLLDMAVSGVPEVEMVVGKAGRVASALDPAPMSMYENVIRYKSEYRQDARGRPLRFQTDTSGAFVYDSAGALIPDPRGAYYRQWREHIRSPQDIWDEIVQVTKLPGVTSAPYLQPIETRLIMLQTGMRAPMGIKVQGPSLAAIEEAGLVLERLLKEVPAVKAEAVFADRVVGKPYLRIELNREVITNFGLRVADVQQHIETALGGMPLSYTVEGRERYAIRLRYARELRDSPEQVKALPVSLPGGGQVQLGQLASLVFERGPQMIKSEDTFLTGYVLFDKVAGYAEVEVISAARDHLEAQLARGQVQLPPGVTWRFTGTYENQLRASKRLQLLVPLTLSLILLLLYAQFRSLPLVLMIFAGVFVAFSGGFWLIWLYGQEGFLQSDWLGVNLRDTFQVQPVYLSVAVWVGFVALFGIATDDGVVMGTYLRQRFAGAKLAQVADIRQAVVEAGKRRVRACLMTTATTVLALLPILTTRGKGADIMLPMAIPIMGGMLLELITLFVVPVLFAAWQEWKHQSQNPTIPHEAD